jgi:hypothetical protein
VGRHICPSRFIGHEKDLEIDVFARTALAAH